MKLRINSAFIISALAFTVMLFLSVQPADTTNSKAATSTESIPTSFNVSAQASTAFEEGWLQMTIAETFPEDDSSPVSRTRYYLVGDSGQALELPVEVASQISAFNPGSRIRVWGLRRGEAGQLLSQSNTRPRIELLESTLPIERTGDHRVLYLLASFDGQEENPFSPDEAARLIDEVSAEFDLMSRSRVRLIPYKPTSWLRVPGPLNCDLFDMTRRVDAVAQASQIPIEEYRYRVYILPSKTDCPFGGVATVGGDPARAWINDFHKRIVVHEYGHAGFSRLHANLWQCPNIFDSTVPGCSAESSNPYSAMGGGFLQLLFSPQDMKDLGWINMLSVTPQSFGRTFRLVASDLNLPFVQNESESLEIQFADLATRVYVDARRNVEEPSVRNGVLVYLEGKPQSGNPALGIHSTHLLPGDYPQDPRQRNYGLALGKGMIIGHNMISVVAADTRGATVYIDDNLDSSPPLATIKNAVRAKKSVTISGSVEDNLIVSRLELWVTRKDKKGKVVARERIKLNSFIPKQQSEISAAEISLHKSQSALIQLVAYDSLDNIGFSAEVSVKKWKSNNPN